MPISAMTLNSIPEQHERQQCADAGGGQRGNDRDGVDVALVEHAEHDVDGDERGEDQDAARWQAKSGMQRPFPGSWR